MVSISSLLSICFSWVDYLSRERMVSGVYTVVDRFPVSFVVDTLVNYYTGSVSVLQRLLGLTVSFDNVNRVLDVC